MRNEKALTANDLMALLKSTDHMAAINSNDITSTRVLSAEQLNKLLDRTDLLPGTTSVTENSHDDNQLFRVVQTDD